MSLIKCPDCSHDVSTTAKSCPNCGYKITYDDLPHKEFKMDLTSLIIGIPILFVICAVTVFVISLFTGISAPGAVICFIIFFLLLTFGAVGSYLKDRKIPD